MAGGGESIWFCCQDIRTWPEMALPLRKGGWLSRLKRGNYQGRNFGPSGTQLRARSNFGLGFALTHILIKSDNSYRRKSIFDLAIADFDFAVVN